MLQKLKNGTNINTMPSFSGVLWQDENLLSHQWLKIQTKA
jgi:hypothetical protein